MSRMRIVNPGVPKTGTPTLTDALRHAGLSVADWRIRNCQNADTNLRGQHLGRIIYQDHFETGDPLARLSEFGTINEMPVVRPHQSRCRQMLARAGNFFEYDIKDSDAATRLSDYLGISLPWRGKATAAKLQQMQRRNRCV